jgi:hypothetical protein
MVQYTFSEEEMKVPTLMKHQEIPSQQSLPQVFSTFSQAVKCYTSPSANSVSHMPCTLSSFCVRGLKTSEIAIEMAEDWVAIMH